MRDKSIKLITTFLVLFFLSSIFNFSPTNIGKNENFQITIKENKPKTSKFWDLTGTPISIDDNDPSKNWSYTASHYDWCSGSGSWTDPYVIENVTVNDNYLGSSIEISNSFAYFIIKNCTFLHSSYSIKLINVNNSKIIGNNCSFNDGSGMSLEYCNNITILQNIMNNNFHDGMVISNSYENVIKQNNLSFNLHCGLALWSGNNNSILENDLDFNGFAAMNLYEGMDNNISRNLMTGCGIKIYGDYSSYKIDSTNKINGKPIYYYTDEIGLNSHNFTNAGQIILVNCKNSTISHLNLSNGTVGMGLYYCDNNTIEYNEFSNNIQFGLFLEECNNNTIINNSANYNDREGIYISHGNDNNILNNSAMWNDARGIYVFYNTYTLIENNTLSFNNRGLTIGQCENCSVKNNTLSSNIFSGLDCYMGINNNISNNYIKNSGREYGMYFSNDKNYNVYSNALVGCGFSLYGDLDSITSHDIKSTNTVNGKPLYYYVNSEYLNPIDFFNAGQVILINCNNSLIANQTISNANIGISCLYCTNITILNNTLSNNNKEGVDIRECKKISICNNTVIDNLNGLSIFDSNNINVSDNHFLLNKDYGIKLGYCLEIVIINNSFNNNEWGIAMVSIVNSTILNNRFENNFIGAIAFLYDNLNIILRNNKMYNCSLNLGGSLESLTTFDIDTSNRVNDKILYYYTNKKYLGEPDFVNAGQIILVNCNNSIISNVNLNNCTIGIGLYHSNNNTVLNTNSSYNSGAGILLFFSNNNSISGNLVRYCKGAGIGIVYSNNNNITENLVENNGGEGIIGSSGLTIYGGFNSQIRKNHIKNNTIGLFLDYASSNNKISENIFFNNLEHGVSIGDINSEQNMFYNNNFIGNLINAEDNGTNNMWDNGIIGNYWDDYAGVDANDDGIGDTPYIVQGTAGSQDNFPILDIDPPEITINYPSSYVIFGSNAPDFVVEIVELYLDTMWYTIDGDITNITFTENGTISQSAWNALPEGIVTLKFYANDSAGNIGFAEVTVTKDVTDPIITINNPQNNDIIGAIAPNFNISIDEPNLDKVWYSLNGGTNITFTGLTGTINQALWDVLPEGNVVIRFYANDSAGNIGFVEVTVTKDVTDPIITINNPQNNDIIGAIAPNFNISIDEPNLDKVWYSLNGGTNITFMGLTGTIDQTLWDSLHKGNVTIRFYANDSAGNIGIQEVTVLKGISQPTPPGIPGYDLLFLLGIISTVAIIIIRKRLNHLN